MIRAACLALVALAASGCSRLTAPLASDAGALGPSVATTDAGSPAPPGKPLTPTWSSSDLTLAELPGAKMKFDADGFAYEMRFQGFPPGTLMVVGGRSTPVSGAHETLRVEVGEVLAKISPANVLEYSFKVDPKLALDLRVPGFDPLRAPAPPVSFASDVTRELQKAVDRPVLFPGEAATNPPIGAHSILYTGSLGAGLGVFGPAATLHDVDWIAVPEALPARSGGKCTIKEDNRPPKNVELRLIDQEVIIVERKTSRVVERKTFPASTECPSYATGDAAETSPDDTTIRRWLRDERAKP